MRTLKWVYKEEFPPTNLPFLSPSTTSSDLKQTHTHTHTKHFKQQSEMETVKVSSSSSLSSSS
jgi:hypothetical protein